MPTTIESPPLPDTAVPNRRRRHGSRHYRFLLLPDTADAVAVADAAWRIRRVNPAFTRITGYAESEALGRTPGLFLADAEAGMRYAAIQAAVAECGTGAGELRGRRKDGSLYEGHLAVSAAGDADGRISHYVLVHGDLSRRKSEESLVRQLIDHDPLTGLPNWDRLQAILDETLAAGTGRETALLMLDLDRFRTINEGLGYHIGDYFLQALAERIVRHAGHEALVARRGGEFCVVLPGLRSRGQAGALARRLLAAIAEPLRLGGQEYVLTASAGLSLHPRDAGDAASLLRYADAAVDQAKREGRNHFRFFAPALKAAIDERLALEKGLRQAVERSQLLLHYQPLVDLASGRIAGVEALVRWQHPELGLVSPARFIPLAEETGCIAAIGDWVLREACRRGRSWHAAGHRGLQVAVNLSPQQFRGHDFPARVAAILDEIGFDPACLDLEITESAIMHEPERAAAILRQFKHRRIRISVDDFGTGYSSLAYLKRFPIDRLKIDRSFVKDCPVDRRDAAIVDTIVRLARNLELEVVAEGVEGEEQLAFLRGRGCDLAQGYLFSRPLPAPEIDALLAGSRALPALCPEV